MMLATRFFAVALSLLAAGAAGASPVAIDLQSPDCVSVDADGEPWDECGFQTFAVSERLGRIAAVTVRGRLRLWDLAGREIAAVEWPDEPGGASGFPDARVAFVGDVVVVALHQNQLLVLDAATGAERHRKVLAAMKVDNINDLGGWIALAYKDRRWNVHGGVYDPAQGKLDDSLSAWRPAPSAWAAGLSVPPARGRTAQVHAAGGPVNVPRVCSLSPRLSICVSQAFGGRHLHLVDGLQGTERAYDVGRKLTGSVRVEWVSVGGRPYASICESRGAARPRRCTLRDLEAGVDLLSYTAESTYLLPSVDESNRAGVLVVHTDQSGTPFSRMPRLFVPVGPRRGAPVAATWSDYRVRLSDLPHIDPWFVASAREASTVFADDGVVLAELPFDAAGCRPADGSTASGCAFTSGGRRWFAQREGRISVFEGAQQ